MDIETKELLHKVLDAIEATKAELSARIDAVDEKLSARIDAVDKKLSTRIDTLEDKVDSIEAKVESLQHVTSANHFKVIGRIDQVASMLADHMADTDVHNPPNRRRA